ncbi:PqiC family protein [Oceaniglobus indicus]|uniref:PqiC family protein n=1 Tax=Oceaniglobus indicus TaxID=2047749 RepID=UPI000C176962|nr:PqiC family protein [Oceaniglobus indicus]
MKPFAAAVVALTALAACSATQTLRYPVPALTATDKIRVSVGSLEVRDVGLPLYAGLEAISVESPTGELLSNSDQLWADDPIRAITQGLAVALSSLTRADVAAEPWPLSERPDARLEVRFTKALASNDGVFRMEGQYFVSSTTGQRREVARTFAVSSPYDAEDMRTIGDALGRATLELAEIIARDGL